MCRVILPIENQVTPKILIVRIGDFQDLGEPSLHLFDFVRNALDPSGRFIIFANFGLELNSRRKARVVDKRSTVSCGELGSKARENADLIDSKLYTLHERAAFQAAPRRLIF